LILGDAAGVGHFLQYANSGYTENFTRQLGSGSLNGINVLPGGSLWTGNGTALSLRLDLAYSRVAWESPAMGNGFGRFVATDIRNGQKCVFSSDQHAVMGLTYSEASAECSLLSENFDAVTNLPGWVMQNNSQPVGTTGWFQGNPAVFNSQSGATNSYIAANFNNASGNATISNWLITPPLTLQNGARLTFYTRTVAARQYPDRLQVRMSRNGNSTDVGSTGTSFGDFTELLLDINPTYTTDGYPNAWTQFTVTLNGISSPTTGRFAFRYFVENGGPASGNSDYIGIDTIEYTFSCSGPAERRFANISTRLGVGTDDSVLIGGFIINGTQPNKTILRALGPSLTQYGVSGALADPQLELYSNGQLIAANNDWKKDPDGTPNPSREAEIRAPGLAPGNDLESAMVAMLAPGPYTAIIRGVNNTTGVALVECFDGDSAGDSQFANISTRGFVQTDNNVMIGGLIVQGNASSKAIVRALGPSLSQYGVSQVLADPTLFLYDGNGSLLISNDNWKESQQAEIEATGLAPSQDLESTIVGTLSPGSYTAIVRGKNGTSGNALIEVYQLGN
ncbi:MAG: hypothetical protein QOI96_165, partial [Verrucomicrobiota bacterium]